MVCVIIKLDFILNLTIYEKRPLSLCESLHFVLFARSSYFALILSCVNIIKLLKFKIAAGKPFKISCSQKVNQVIDWNCCPYLPKEKEICWELFPCISLLVAYT